VLSPTDQLNVSMGLISRDDVVAQVLQSPRRAGRPEEEQHIDDDDEDDAPIDISAMMAQDDAAAAAAAAAGNSTTIPATATALLLSSPLDAAARFNDEVDSPIDVFGMHSSESAGRYLYAGSSPAATATTPTAAVTLQLPNAESPVTAQLESAALSGLGNNNLAEATTPSRVAAATADDGNNLVTVVQMEATTQLLDSAPVQSAAAASSPLSLALDESLPYHEAGEEEIKTHNDAVAKLLQQSSSSSNNSNDTKQNSSSDAAAQKESLRQLLTNGQNCTQYSIGTNAEGIQQLVHRDVRVYMTPELRGSIYWTAQPKPGRPVSMSQANPSYLEAKQQRELIDWNTCMYTNTPRARRAKRHAFCSFGSVAAGIGTSREFASLKNAHIAALNQGKASTFDARACVSLVNAQGAVYFVFANKLTASRWLFALWHGLDDLRMQREMRMSLEARQAQSVTQSPLFRQLRKLHQFTSHSLLMEEQALGMLAAASASNATLLADKFLLQGMPVVRFSSGSGSSGDEKAAASSVHSERVRLFYEPSCRTAYWTDSKQVRLGSIINVTMCRGGKQGKAWKSDALRRHPSHLCFSMISTDATYADRRTVALHFAFPDETSAQCFCVAFAVSMDQDQRVRRLSFEVDAA
jgi:hypothetical protein